LLSFSSSGLIKSTVVFPVSATFIAAVFALTVDYYRLFDYYWMCEKVLLPSFSRIINLPYERTFWNLLILAHIPLRLISLFQFYIKFAYFANARSSKLTSLTLLLFIISGLLDSAFISLLTVVGERESGMLHMILFICFILTIMAFISSHLLLSIRCGVRGKNEILSFRIRLFLFFSLIIAVALLTTAFWLFQEHCVKYSYSTFACLEYSIIAMILTYHSTALLDLDFTMTLIY
ncbi:hypothetical protein PFISCL1PPCAC_101, partial [Pristionchus fissidentatus]